MRAMIATAVAFAMVLMSGIGAAHGDPKTVQSTMGEDERGWMYFDPAVLEIMVGDTVTWTNVGIYPHEVASHLHAPVVGTVPTGTGAEFETVVEPGDTFSWTFESVGVYLVNCNLGGNHNYGHQVITVTD